MATTNGWTKWLVATLWGVLVMVIMFMGNVVRGNDLNNRKDHTIIIDGSMKRHEIQEGKIEHVKEIVTNIRLDLRTMAVELKQGLTQIEKKL